MMTRTHVRPMPHIIPPMLSITSRISWVPHSSGQRPSVIKKRMGARSGHSRGLKPVEPKAGRLDQDVDRAIEVTAAGKPAPQRIEPVLPARDARFRRPAVLDEEQRPARPEDAGRLGGAA